MRVRVRATPTWRVVLLPKALGDPEILENTKSYHQILSRNPRLSVTIGDREGSENVVVTCVGSIRDRKSILADIPVG